MKNIIMFILLVVCIGTNAQKYVPFPTENAKWNVFYASSWDFSPMNKTLLQYSLQGGDTIINEKTYHKFCQNIGTKDNPVYRGIGGIREQDRKIYYCGPPYTLNHNAQGDDFEYLLYDFSKQIGDTVWINENRKYVITEIDSIKAGNQYRKRYQISGPYMLNNIDYIIEGIGSVKAGLLGSITDIPTCEGCQYEWNFVCFNQNGETLYLNPEFVDCNSTRKWSDLPYVAFPTENAAWNVFYAYSYNGEPMDTTMLQYSLQGDTTISGKLYRKVCRNIGSYIDPIYKGLGGLREQDKKVYYFGLSYYEKLGTIFDNEIMLYDFNKQVDDTVWLDYLQINSASVNYIISEIDSIKIGVEFRKRYKLKPHNAYETPEYIIEGIGNITSGLFGVITPIPTCLECHQDWQFICFSQNGETVYLNPAFVDCNSLLMTPMSESKASNRFVKIFPNPANEYIQIQFNNAATKNTTIKILDHAGKLLVTIPVSIGLSIYNFDMSRYPAGVYFVLVHSLYGNEVHKIIRL